MTNQEFLSFIDRANLLFDDVRRFLDSRKDQKQELMREWHRVLTVVESADANAVLDRMLDGSLARVDYFDMGRFPNIVLFESRIIANARREHAKRFSDGPRYRCATCLDSGLVNVWNPVFVDAYREEFVHIDRITIDRDKHSSNAICYNLDRFDPKREIIAYRYNPPNWIGIASRWWRTSAEAGGPIHFLVRCNCDGEASERLLKERQQFKAGERRKGTAPLGMPICGMADYNPRVMPRKTPNSYEDLFEWYADTEPGQLNEWQGTAEEYAAHF